ncbi:MAG: hypothetical protein Q8N17_26935 [Burkholderiaceae bacterium]|nr:hypothetical protein [Burkholderiaceae bacterium]
MISKPPLPPTRKPLAENLDEEIYLMGATGLEQYLEFVRERAVGGREMDRGELSQSWRAAAEVFKEMQASQAGAADKPPVLPLPASIQSHIDELTTLAHFEQTFNHVPVAFGMVELDRLVVCQHHIGRASVERMLTQTPRPVSDQDLARICLPLTPPDASFKVAMDDGERFVFISDTHDARFLGARIVNPADIANFPVNGHAQAVIALTVGFTTNVLNVVRYGPRMVLNNGYHRALALRAMGVTHAPCLIQVCAHWEDVGLVGGGEMYRNGEPYFSTLRPPMLKDFADPKLTEKFLCRRLTREINVSYEVDKRQISL